MKFRASLRYRNQLAADYSTVAERAATTKTSYLTNDHLGSPRVVTDQFGQVISRRDFHPFGEEIATPQRTQSLGYIDDSVRQKFTGYERDNEINLDFAEARYYNSMHGRFTSPDPLMASGSPDNPQTWNRYIYVGNNPLFWVDSTGLIWGINEDNEVRWFDKKLGSGFSEFKPDAWQYEAANGRIVQLDPNSSKWNFIDPVEVVAESNPIQVLVQSTGQNLSDSITGMEIGASRVVDTLTNPLGPVGAMAGVPNPFEIAAQPGNARQAAYALITETAITSAASAGVGAAVAGPASAGSSLSVVPEVSAATRTPSFLGQASGPSIAIPDGVSATTVVNRTGRTTGLAFTGGRGGNGLHDAVTGVRIMNPTSRYPNGYVTYMGNGRQGINPLTGRTIPNSDRWRHIPLGR